MNIEIFLIFFMSLKMVLPMPMRTNETDLSIEKPGYCPERNELDFICGLHQCRSDNGCPATQKCVSFNF